MGAEVTDTRKIKARQRAERIRLHLGEAAQDYAAAVVEEDWRHLGYESAEEWRVSEFGQQRFTPVARKQVAAMLSAAGKSRREIAAATGVSKDTAQRDLSGKTGHEAGVYRGDTPEKTHVAPDLQGNAPEGLPHQQPNGGPGGDREPAPAGDAAPPEKKPCGHPRFAYRCTRCGAPLRDAPLAEELVDRMEEAEARASALEARNAELETRAAELEAQLGKRDHRIAELEALPAPQPEPDWQPQPAAGNGRVGEYPASFWSRDEGSGYRPPAR